MVVDVSGDATMIVVMTSLAAPRWTIGTNTDGPAGSGALSAATRVGPGTVKDMSELSTGTLVIREDHEKTKYPAEKHVGTEGSYDSATYNHGLGRSTVTTYVEALNDALTDALYETTDWTEREVTE